MRWLKTVWMLSLLLLWLPSTSHALLERTGLIDEWHADHEPGSSGSHRHHSTDHDAARQIRDRLLPRADTLQRAADARLAAGEASLAEVLPIHRDVATLRLTYYEALREVMEAWATLQPHLAARAPD